MTASAREARLLKTARQILEEAGRPLSVRRILRAGEADDRFEGQPGLEELRDALLVGLSEGLVQQARRGIFTLASGEPDAPTPAPTPAAEVDASAPESAEVPKRRRRRRESPEAAGSANTPTTLDEAAALSAGSDREALKGKLWSRLQRKASEVTDQPLADGDASAAPAEAGTADAAGDADRAPKGRRRRRESGTARSEEDAQRPASEKPRRRRRRSESEPPDAVAASPEKTDKMPEKAADGPADPRAALKARLARRSRPAADAPAPPAPSNPAAAETASGDTRSALKRRLAARLAGASAEPATEAPPAPAAAAEEAPAKPSRAPSRRRRRDSGAQGASDARSALKSRLAARLTGDSNPDTAKAVAAAVDPADAPGEGSARAALKARMASRSGGRSKAPASPTAPPAEAATTPGAATHPRDALKARLAARADRSATEPVATPKKAAEAAPKAKAGPARKSDAGDPRAALKARLANRRGVDPKPAATTPAPKAEAASKSSPSGEPRAAMKARLAARRGTDTLEVPLAESRRPYREKRQAEVAPKAERRSPGLAEVSPTNALTAAALAALRGHGSPLTIDALTDAVDGNAEAGSIGLQAALRAENGRRELIGLRPLFVAHYGGAVGLTEWGLSDRYRALEGRIQEALAEQRELVRRDLLARVGELTDAGFEQVIVMLLEQLGHGGVKVVHRQAGTVALTVSREAEGGGTEKIAVVARKSWGPIKQGTVRRLRDTLAHFEADSGLVMTIGTFAASARTEARQDGLTHVRLIDGAGLAGLLYEHGIGLSTHRPVMRHLDVAFFASLEA